MNMIDQVAIALCPERWEAISGIERELWRSRARVAIEAMREPTGEQVDVWSAFAMAHKGYRMAALVQGWYRGIDAALKEGN